MTFLIGFVVGSFLTGFGFYFATHPEDRHALFSRIKDAISRQ